MKKLVYSIIILSLMLALPACSMKKAVGKMSLELRGVHISNVNEQGFDANIMLKVNNPNWFGMTVSDVSYKAYVGGQELATGSSDTEVVIPGEGSAIAELPVTVTYGNLRDSMYEILRGRLGYRVVGEVGFSTWLGRYAMPFDTEKKPKDDNKPPPVSGGTI